MTTGKKGKAWRRSIGWSLAFAWLLAGTTFAGPAVAGSFTVNPVQINLPAGRPAASLTITNSDAAPVSVRVVTYAWTQVDGSDVYTPTNNVIASPPIFTIPPGKTQLVRVGVKTRTGPGAYRVIFEEIPRQKPSDRQIQVTLRLNLPLYLMPERGAKAALTWTAWRDRTGDLFVEGRNSGPVHAQILELSADHDGKRDVLSKQMGVVLAGSSRLWKAGKRADFKSGRPLVLKVRSSTDETQTQIVLEQR